ncbi:hypothetical protein RY72_11805 [Akkermansia muciniphila]|nr:hypothetical protein [Akkermansia muciniphila]
MQNDGIPGRQRSGISQFLKRVIHMLPRVGCLGGVHHEFRAGSGSRYRYGKQKTTQQEAAQRQWKNKSHIF